MDYQYFKDKIGSRFDIVQGELVETLEGMFLVTDQLQNYSIYINKKEQSANLISPKSSYIGRSYGLRQADCVAICLMYLDNNHGTKFMERYKATPNKVFYQYYIKGMGLWFEENGFTKVDTPEIGDMLVYANTPDAISHVGVYIKPNKILHHLPNKFSCIDDIEKEKIKGIYRYG